MTKENLKLVSVRIDPDTIEKIDEFVKQHYYWKRNGVINAILWAAMHDFKTDDVYDMVRRNRYKTQAIDCKYEIV